MPKGKKNHEPKHEEHPLPDESAPPCSLNDVCSWVSRMAPRAAMSPNYPAGPEGPMPPRQGGRAPWLQDMWECYAELYVAVARLERVMFCQDQTITKPYIVDCGGPGGGPGKGGSPPPPPFP